MIAIVVVPLTFGGLTFWMLTRTSMGASMSSLMAFFISAVVALACVFIVIEWNPFPGYRERTSAERRELHIADDEVSGDIWFEIECLLTEYPESLGVIAPWMADLDGKLHYRHLWELRRRYTYMHFRDGVVETSWASNEWGVTIDDLVISGHPIKMPKGPKDVLEGKLMSRVEALRLGRDTPRASAGEPVRRL